jgi:hypothetical protein
MMNKLVLLFSICSISLTAQHYGAEITSDNALEATDISAEMAGQDQKIVKVKGVVQEVCQVKGCWLTMETSENTSMRVTFKDYGFFVPTDCSGKTAVLQGQLTTETLDIATLQHLARDAGKSETEIASITEPLQELVLVADGVLFLEQ